MIRIPILILFVFTLCDLNAQPEPCTGKNVLIIDGINGIQKDDSAYVQIMEIGYWDSLYPQVPDLQPNWSNCLIGDSIDSEHLYLYTPKYFGCQNMSVKSNRSERYYLIGHAIGGVITIKVRDQHMYLVLPDITTKNSNTTFAMKAHKHLKQIDFKTENPEFYTPYIYLPEIDFKPGIFFLEGYKTAESFKEFDVSDVSEFHALINDTKASPNRYWSDKVAFYAPYPEALNYSKEYNGAFSEKEAIEVIVQNSSRYLHTILKHHSWAKYIKNATRTESDNELRRFLFDLKKAQDAEIDALESELYAGEISEQTFLQQFNALEERHLYSILESDFDLTVQFSEYLLKNKDNIDSFKALFDESNRINKIELEHFLSQQNSRNK